LPVVLPSGVKRCTDVHRTLEPVLRRMPHRVHGRNTPPTAGDDGEAASLRLEIEARRRRRFFVDCATDSAPQSRPEALEHGVCGWRFRQARGTRVGSAIKRVQAGCAGARSLWLALPAGSPLHLPPSGGGREGGIRTGSIRPRSRRRPPNSPTLIVPTNGRGIAACAASRCAISVEGFT
jgi:hypothetical protein